MSLGLDGRIDPDETVKRVYREVKRGIRPGTSPAERRELEARLEFLERIFRL